jgi:hypothetical protein
MAESDKSLPVRDLLAENFGLLIAYVVPGLAALWACALWDVKIGAWMAQAGTLDTTIGGFLILTVAALGAGMLVQALRFALFELLLPKSSHALRWWPYLTAPSYEHRQRRDPEVRAALREITDQHYRYYQCHGGLSVALVAVLVAWCVREENVSFGAKAAMAALCLVCLAALFLAAMDALRRTRERMTEIQRPVREVA